MNQTILILCFLMLFVGCERNSAHEDSSHGEAHGQAHDQGEEARHKEGYSGEEGKVHLSEASQRLIGLELVKVQRRPLTTTIEVIGEIASETENVYHVTPKEPGVLRSLHVGLGAEVEEGTPLCIIETNAGSKVEIRSPAHGILLSQYAKAGDSVDTLTSILTITNPDVLRASFNVYEKDIAKVRIGQKVLVESIAYPDNEFEGRIVFISPGVDQKTRAIKIRVDVKNEEHLLRFGMFATGQIFVPLSEESLVIPQAAVQVIEDRDAVFVPAEEGPDVFQVLWIQTARRSGGFIEVIGGPEEGQVIVGKGSFYLKAELLKGELEEGHAH